MAFLQNTVLLNNTLADWGIALGAALAALIAIRVFVRVIIGRIARLAARTRTDWDDLVAHALGRTKLSLLTVIALYVGSQVLTLSEGLRRAIISVTVIALLVQAGIWAGAALSFWLRQYRERELAKDRATVTTLTGVTFVAKMVIWSVVLLLALDNLGIDITALVAGLGIGGIAVALAMQNILGDLFASLSIVLDKPFVIGDFLIVDDYLGTVEHIGLKTTRVRSLSGEQLVFANSDLLNSRLRNYGRMFERRVLFKLGVTYQTPREKLTLIPTILRTAVEAQQQTRFDRSHFMEYGDFSLNVETVYYVLSSDYAAYMDIHQAILLQIHERFEQEGIEFAYPTQTVFVARDALL